MGATDPAFLVRRGQDALGGRIGFFSPKLGALALSNGCVAMAQGAKTVFVSIGTTPIFQERRPTSKALRSALYAKAPVVIADAEGRGVFS